MEEKTRQQQHQMESAEAELDAEEAEHIKRLTESINEEHVRLAHENHKALINGVCKDLFVLLLDGLANPLCILFGLILHRYIQLFVVRK